MNHAMKMIQVRAEVERARRAKMTEQQLEDLETRQRDAKVSAVVRSGLSQRNRV